jgi:Calcineurin-like phosphoesterase
MVADITTGAGALPCDNSVTVVDTGGRVGRGNIPKSSWGQRNDSGDKSVSCAVRSNRFDQNEDNSHMATRRGVWMVALTAAALLLGGQAGAKQYAEWIQIGPPGWSGDMPSATTAQAAFNATAPLVNGSNVIQNTILARAIVDTTDACPALSIDGVSQGLLTQRFSNTSEQSSGTFSEPTMVGGKPGGTFPVQECEAVVPAGHSVATVGGVPLHLPSAAPQRILVIGDTGCRMSGTGSQEDCNSPQTFPLAYLASVEAALRPDLVIHVGDYFYRDTNCTGVLDSATSPPTLSSTCATPGSTDYEPWGDNWQSWHGDVFGPAKPLLDAAPWVMVRGNHESCGRGSQGWYTLIDPHQYNANAVQCPVGKFDNGTSTAYTNGSTPYGFDFEPTYLVSLGPKVTLIVHDSSFASDTPVVPATASRYAVDMAAVVPVIPSATNAIFATHKPTFGLVSGTPTNGGDFTEQSMWYSVLNGGSGVPLQIGLLLSGHIHQFEYLNFQNYTQYAPQMIVGVGGTLLDPETVPPNVVYNTTNAAFTVNQTTGSTTTTTVTSDYSRDEFGYALLTPTANGYNASVYNIGSSNVGRCAITLVTGGGLTRSISCVLP